MSLLNVDWVKTTLTSWVSTITGIGVFSLAEYKDEIQAWAALIGGLLVPLAAFLFHVYKSTKKKED